MSFDMTRLICDRTQADVNYVTALTEKLRDGKATEAEIAEWNKASLRGAYNYTDLNRVYDAMEYLKNRLSGYGYNVPGYQRVSVRKGNNGLPEGFTPLAWIESTGTQYFDTGFVPNQDTRVVCKAVMPVGEATKFVFGARQSSSSRQFMFAASSGGYYTSGYGSASAKFDAAFNSDNPIVVDKNKAVTTLTLSDGTSGQVEGTVSTFTAPNNMVLFGCNTAGTVAKSTARIYSCQIYDSDTLIRDYVPCINSAGVVGLYDMVNGIFSGSATDTPFVAGDAFTVDERDPYTWYEDDTPNVENTTAYLNNVAALRKVLTVFKTTPAVPADMEGFTYQEANAIEQILMDMEVIINAFVPIMLRSAQPLVFSGFAVYPTHE